VIGAATPCGHCFHEACFEGWRASKLPAQQARGRLPWYELLGLPGVKCPLCAKETRDFCRLYLDLGALGNAGGDDSDEDSSLGSCEGQENEFGGGGNRSAAASGEADDGSEIKPLPSMAEEFLVDEAKKYRAKAKRLKSRIVMLESQRAQQSEELRDVQERYAKNRKELVAVRKDLEEFDTQIGSYEREREGTCLELVQLRREKQELSSKLDKASAAKDRAERHLADARKEHARELQKVQHSTMTEVQKMLSEQPSLIKENREMKQLLSQYRQILRDAQSQPAPAKRAEPIASELSKPSSRASDVRGPQPKKSAPASAPTLAFEAVRLLGLQDARHTQTAAAQAKKRRDREERNASSKAELKGKVSAHAARLSTSATSRYAAAAGGGAGEKPNPISLLSARLDDENDSSRARKRPSSLFQMSLDGKKARKSQPLQHRVRDFAGHGHRPSK
jgi:predicted  nucleic acid-binding Zn-ribbon protein